MADVAEVLMFRDPGGVCDCADAGPTSVLKPYTVMQTLSGGKGVLIAPPLKRNAGMITGGGGGGLVIISGPVKPAGTGGSNPSWFRRY